MDVHVENAKAPLFCSGGAEWAGRDCPIQRDDDVSHFFIDVKQELFLQPKMDTWPPL